MTYAKLSFSFMKNEIFVTIQHLKRSMLKWRILAIVAIFLLIIASSNRDVFKSQRHQSIIARVKINTPISNGLFSDKKLKLLEEDTVKGIILEIDSPGGDVMESEKMHSFFKKLAIKKPLVVTIKGICTSGAYMMAIASNYIIAYNTSLVGSIGVIVESYEITELAKKLGISLTNYKSSPLKAALNPFEKITPDVDMVISQEIDDIYDYFLGIFIDRRKIKVAEAQEIANGQIYTGRQALEFGLIDKIGGEDEVMEYLKVNNFNLNKIKIVDFDIYEDQKRTNLMRSLLDVAISNSGWKNIKAISK
jgi:protease-4